MDVNEMNKSIASMYCDRCDTLEDDIQNNLIGILKRSNNIITVKDCEEISDDDIVITVYDDDCSSPAILRLRGVVLEDDKIYMYGDLDGEAGSYWLADSLEDYYWCMKFISIHV